MGTKEFNAGRSPCDRLASHPERIRNTPSRSLDATEVGINSGVIGHLVRMETSPFTRHDASFNRIE